MNWTAWALERSRMGARELLLLVTARGSPSDGRAKTVVNLVLDRSGSMKGPPLTAAIEAAREVVEACSDDDVLGLCTFDRSVEQRCPMVQMNSEGRRRMISALAAVQAGSGTALHGAIVAAADHAQRCLVPGSKPRLLVLTDGEPSVGPDRATDFAGLGRMLAAAGVQLHALGLAEHYVADILEALTTPSGNGFLHVDGPDGLAVAMGSVFGWLRGEVATDARASIVPFGLSMLSCRHSFPIRQDRGALTAMLGSIGADAPRHALFCGVVQSAPAWVEVRGSCIENGDQRRQSVEVLKTTESSLEGRRVLGVDIELALLAAESNAWHALADAEKNRAEALLDQAELKLRELVILGDAGVIPNRRHLDRIADLRVAIEHGEGDLRRGQLRARSESSITSVGQLWAGASRLRN